MESNEARLDYKSSDGRPTIRVAPRNQEVISWTLKLDRLCRLRYSDQKIDGVAFALLVGALGLRLTLLDVKSDTVLPITRQHCNIHS